MKRKLTESELVSILSRQDHCIEIDAAGKSIRILKPMSVGIGTYTKINVLEKYFGYSVSRNEVEDGSSSYGETDNGSDMYSEYDRHDNFKMKKHKMYNGE